jgi:hypothetical protein
MFQKELYNCIPNVSAWRVLRKCLHLEAYELSIVQHLEHYATSLKVADSVLDEVNGFFLFTLPNPSSRTRPWCLISL